MVFTAYERLPWMIESIDNHWVLLGVRHGFIVPLLMLCAFVGAIACVALSAAQQKNEADRRICVGLTIVLFAILVCGFTVAFFGSLASWIYVVLGIGVSVRNATLRSQPEATRTEDGS